jgi:hypothetical protein
MRTILKGGVLLFLVIMALSVMSCIKAVDTELFVHKSPDFTLTVPKWVDLKSQDPNNILKRKPELGAATNLDVVVHDLRAGMTYKDTPPVFKKALENLWEGSDVKILYEREIKLKDGTPAYEFEMKWKNGIWPLRTYAVIVFKEKKIILVDITSLLWVGDNQKQYPLSLTLK